MTMSTHFTPRQLEILDLIASGKTDKDIAFRLQVSRRTVAAHLQRLYLAHGFHPRPAGPAVTASAANPRSVGNSTVVYLSPDRSFAVLVPLPGVSKQSYSASRDLQALNVQLGPQTVTSSTNVSGLTGRTGSKHTVTAAGTLSASNSNRTCPPGGLCDNTTAWFSTTVNAQSGWWVATMTFGPGQSQAAWLGCCPWNATTMY